MEFQTHLNLMAPTFAAILATAGFLLASLAFGDLALRPLAGDKIRHPVMRLLIKTVVGADILALLAFALSISSLCSKAVVVPILLLGSARGAWILLGGAVRNPRRLIPSKTISVFLLAVMPFFILFAGAALCPPTGMGLDELSYQITVPLRWVQDNFPALCRDLPYSGFPSSTGFIFQFLIVAGGVKTARLFILAVHILDMLLLFLLARHGAGRLLAAALTLSVLLGPAYIFFLPEVYVESFVVLNLLGAFAFMKYSRATAGPGRTGVVFGVLAAGAMSVKLTGLFPAAAIFAMCLASRGCRKISALFWAAFSAAALAAPFYLRPAILTGNPFYPYFANLFTNNPATVLMSERHHLMGHLGGEKQTGPLDGLCRLAFDDAFFDGNLGGQLFVFILLWLLVLPGVFGRGLKNWRNILLACAPLALCAAWALTSRQARFLFPAVFLSILVAFHFRGVLTPRLKAALGATLLAVAAVFAPWQWASHFKVSWKCALGLVDQRAFMFAAFGDHLGPALEFLHAQRGNEKTLVLFERRALYFSGRFIIGTPFYQEELFTPPPKNEVEIQGEISKRGIRRILLCKTLKYEESRPENAEKIRPLLEGISSLAKSGALKVVWASPSHVILEVTSP